MQVPAIHTSSRHQAGRRTGLLAGAILAFQAAVPAVAAELPPELGPEHAAVARAMLDYMARTEGRIFAAVEALNGRRPVETREFRYDDSVHVVKVTRGKVVEKAGWYVFTATKPKPPFLMDPLWNRYIEINIHPTTPHVGMLHATVFMSIMANGKSALAGYLDYVPGVWHETDNARLRAALDRAYEAGGMDLGRFRRQLCESAFGAKHHRDNLKAACVGASLYDPPFLEVTAANFAVVTGGFDAFVDEYLAILSERRRQRVTAADLQARDAMRRRWLEDQLFADTLSMKVVPYEVWSLANQAPTVRF